MLILPGEILLMHNYFDGVREALMSQWDLDEFHVIWDEIAELPKESSCLQMAWVGVGCP
jgi:hypothetical protein